MSGVGVRQRRASQRPAPASRAFYLKQAEACLAAAARAGDVATRALHEEECKLWLMLARQREAIEAVLQRYIDAPGPA
jgi:hypothetical protein